MSGQKMQMKTLMAALVMTTAMTMPALAKPVTFSTTLSEYGGRGAYFSLYLTDAKGDFAGTVWLAGGKTKYHRHLTDWARLSGGVIDAATTTGASVGAGRNAQITIDVADALFDAGYTLHMDAAVEDMRDSPSEIELPLTSTASSVRGRRYIDDFGYTF
jgi:hypothetical protein